MTFENHLHSLSRAVSQKLVSWGCPDECSMIYHFHKKMLSWLCPVHFGVLSCSVVLGCQYTPYTNGPRSQCCPFSNWGVCFICDIDHCRSMAVLCRLYKSRYNPMHPFNDALPGRRTCRGIHSVLWSSPQNLTDPQDLYSPLNIPVERSYWPCIRWCGTGGFQEQGQCLFIGLSCSSPFCLLPFFPFSCFCL